MEVSPTADLVFSISAFRGRYYANIRKFQHTERYSGPTKAGLALRSDLLSWLVEQLTSIRMDIPNFQEAEIARTSKREDVDIVIQMTPPRETSDLYQLDVREYVKSERYSGPTKKGIRFGIDNLPRAVDLLKGQAAKIAELEQAQPSLFDQAGESKGKDREAEEKQVDTDQVVSETLPEGPKRFPDSFLGETDGSLVQISLPPEPIRLGQLSSGKQQIVSEMGFIYEAKNPVEGKYIVYAHMAGSRAVKIPEKPFDVFRTVKQYKIYVRGIQKSLTESYHRRTAHRPTAEHLAKSAFKKLGLPWLSE